ncbi:NEQ466 [Nanoarchaeum equitans Kin4-M]|uniref:Ribonuclease J n=1 Tax=Nanoarchaeum equitans (strain Kin4-M) TaxID=228908 RepID=Q74M96_NANEQ|nr:NEQ466 [Nanoarchaeum equitans Kin4-M]
MKIEVRAVGGYNEIGANMTAIGIDDEWLIIDMGVHVDKMLAFQKDQEEVVEWNRELLEKINALPKIEYIEDIKDKVKAILITHGHLDHIGAVIHLAYEFNAPIIGPPYAIELIRSFEKDYKIILPNEMKKINLNSSIQISDKISVDFIYATHSIPHSAHLAIHTPKGVIFFSGDYKFDNFPVIGQRYNLEKLKEIAKEGVILAFIESTRADEDKRSYSEIIAREMLRDVLFEEHEGLIIMTTFSSHIARLKSMVELSLELDRDVYILGRSMVKNVEIAEKLGIYKFSDKAKIYQYHDQIARLLKKIDDRSKYALIVTGNQGEPGSVLWRMAFEKFPFRLDKKDTVIFSCFTIPNAINIAFRNLIEEKIKSFGTRIIKDVHVSGHAMRDDHYRLIKILKPQIIIPNHGDFIKRGALADLAMNEFGYSLGKDLFLIQNGQRINFEF